MIIGVPKEMKKAEYRVSIIPSGAGELRKAGHTVLIEKEAGEGCGFHDREYLESGAQVSGRTSLFERSDLIVKVKEPAPEEYDLIGEGQSVFAFLHLASNRDLTNVLLKKKVTGLAYETLRKDGVFPLLAPMSEIAGKMAPMMGSFYLQKFYGGRGVLFAGATGIKPAKAVILGAGVVGTNAARVCIGLRMDTVVINRDMEGLKKVEELFGGKVKTVLLTSRSVREEIRNADIVIGAVLVPGGKAPVLITRDMLRDMNEGAVIVDVSIDQGGCVETSRPTTHDDPVYEVDGIVHYAVANMPGAYPRTSTVALTTATLPYIETLAEKGVEKAIEEDAVIRSSLNTYRGEIVNKALADSMSEK